MPYFVYKIEKKPLLVLNKLESFPTFKEASAYAKSARGGVPDGVEVKVIFAENELQAEDLLSTVREPKPKTGDDD